MWESWMNDWVNDWAYKDKSYDDESNDTGIEVEEIVEISKEDYSIE